MVEAFPVAPGVYQLRVAMRVQPPATPMPIHGTAYVVRDERTVLIEPGPRIIAPALLEGLERLQVPFDSVAYIIPTHVHVDHAGGAGTLVKTLTRAQVLAHPRGARHLVEPGRLIQATREVFGGVYERDMGEVEPIPQEKVRAMQDGETVSLGRRELQIIHSPGHSPHHIAIWDATTRGLFCGEALGLYRPGTGVVIPSVAPPEYDVDAELETIAKLEALNPSLILYSHHTVRDDVAAVFGLLRQSIQRYGEIIARGKKEGLSDEDIVRRISDYIRGEMPAGMASAALQVRPQLVSLFKKKGLY